MSETPEQSLSVTLHLPLRWRALPVGESARGNQLGNHSLLRVLEGLDGPVATEPTWPERELFQRLDAKLNLMLSMLSSVLSREQSLPQGTELRLSAQEMSWVAAAEAPILGQCLEISLYPHPQLPVPLIFEGRVTGLISLNSDSRINLQLNLHDEEMQTELEKFIFRQHRHEIRRKRDRR